MARHTIVKLIDDLTGGDADQTVTFGLDDSVYRIDLSDKNAAKLRKFLADYVAAAERLGRLNGGKPTAGPVKRNPRHELAKIRQWAKENGYEVSDRGRIPAEVQAAYRKATGKGS